MSKIKPESAYAKKVFEGFGDLGAGGGHTSAGATSLMNFRVNGDGSLEKRCGWRLHSALGGAETRGVWQGNVNGDPLLLAVNGDQVLQLYNGKWIPVTTLPTSTGRVRFFRYRDALYLLDGESIRVWDSELHRFNVAEGYAPLFGQQWHPLTMGKTNEPLNLLCDRLRVHYSNTIGSNTFVLPFYAEKVDLVRVDGKRVTNYTLSAAGDTLILTTTGSSVEVAFTMALDSDTQRDLRGARQSFVAQVGAREALLLYGAPRGHLIYVSANVSDDMINFCRVSYPKADRLYFRADELLVAADPDHPVTTVCRDRDRLLAFSDLGASSISLSAESDAVESYVINGAPGCAVRDMDVMLCGKRFLCNAGGVFRLVRIAGEKDAFELTPIKLPLALSDPSLFSRLQVGCDVAHGELWFRDPEDESGTVTVYRPDQKRAYRFDNIAADWFLVLDGGFGFASDAGLCLFEESLTTDGGEAFTATAETGWLDFGAPEIKKRSLRVSLLAHGARETVLCLESEHRRREMECREADSSHPTLLDARAPLGRFRLLRVGIRDSGVDRPRIHRLALYANL